jgi:hypothetical protein
MLGAEKSICKYIEPFGLKRGGTGNVDGTENA